MWVSLSFCIVLGCRSIAFVVGPVTARVPLKERNNAKAAYSVSGGTISGCSCTCKRRDGLGRESHGCHPRQRTGTTTGDRSGGGGAHCAHYASGDLRGIQHNRSSLPAVPWPDASKGRCITRSCGNFS